MTEEELYLFDTLGFLRVENVLDQNTVALAYESSQRIVRDYEHLIAGKKGGSYGESVKHQRELGTMVQGVWFNRLSESRRASSVTRQERTCRSIDPRPAPYPPKSRTD